MNIETLAARYQSIPSHWRLAQLGEVLTAIIGGGTPSRDDASFWGGDIPWLTVKDMRTRRPPSAQEHITARAVKESATNIIPPDTVITATRVGLGKVVRVPFASAINQDLKALIAGPELDKSYLEYWIVSIATFLESIGSGTTVKGIRLETLRQLPIPLAPISEQREIVAELEKQFSRLDEAVANLQRVKANLKRYKASVLKAAVEGRLVETEASIAHREGRTFESGEQLLQRLLEVRKKNSKAKRNVALSPLPPTLLSRDIPTGWTWTTTGQLCDCIVPNRDKPKTFTGDIPWLTLPDFDDSEIAVAGSKSGLGFTESEVQLYSAKVIPVDSVVMSCVGRFGISAVLSRKSVINQQLHAFLPNESVLPRYLAYVLRTREQEMVARSTATTIAYLNKENCNSITVPLPPLAEQTRIVAEIDRHLSIVREVEAEVDTNRKRAQALRQATLARAFQGG